MDNHVAVGVGSNWAGVITWFIVVIGWIIVHNATLARDRRKEKREISMHICKEIADLQATAIDFHTATDFDARKSTDLAQQVDRVCIRLQKYPPPGVRLVVASKI